MALARARAPHRPAKLLVVMGPDARAFVNSLAFPLADELTEVEGELQRFTPTIQAVVTPDVDTSLDEQPAKTRFWKAFKIVGSWWAELPPRAGPAQARRGRGGPGRAPRLLPRRRLPADDPPGPTSSRRPCWTPAVFLLVLLALPLANARGLS